MNENIEQVVGVQPYEKRYAYSFHINAYISRATEREAYKQVEDHVNFTLGLTDAHQSALMLESSLNGKTLKAMARTHDRNRDELNG